VVIPVVNNSDSVTAYDGVTLAAPPARPMQACPAARWPRVPPRQPRTWRSSRPPPPATPSRCRSARWA
jgi:hypothetical protein